MYIKTIQVNLPVYLFKVSVVSTLVIIGSKVSSSFSSSDDRSSTTPGSCGETEFLELEGTSIGVIIGLSGAIIAEVPNSNNKLIVN